MSDKVVTLDVRPDIERGVEPFSRIMRTVAGLNGGEDLLLIAPFEPVPLFAVLARQGFGHLSHPTPSGDWEVLFSRSPQRLGTREVTPTSFQSPASFNESKNPPDAPGTTDLDARGLEPPQPLVKILEALGTLPEGSILRARTDRRPLHLLPRLAERGYHGDIESHPDGGFVTIIRRA
jgi:uncharacterized protein (DUF2249 family)